MHLKFRHFWRTDIYRPFNRARSGQTTRQRPPCSARGVVWRVVTCCDARGRSARTLVTHATSAAKPSTCAFSASSAFRDTNSGKYEFCKKEKKRTAADDDDDRETQTRKQAQLFSRVVASTLDSSNIISSPKAFTHITTKPHTPTSSLLRRWRCSTKSEQASV